jgi:hypothetical protein
MPEQPPPDATPAYDGAADPVNPQVRFERKDANVRYIVWFAVGLAAVAVATQILFSGVFAGMMWRKKPAGPTEPLLTQDRLRLPKDLQRIPEPRLQMNQELDLQALRAYEDKLLDNKQQPYGWVDGKQEFVRIPIERAMEVLSDPKRAAAHGVRERPEAEGRGGALATKTHGPRPVPAFQPGPMKAGRGSESVRPAQPGSGEGR